MKQVLRRVKDLLLVGLGILSVGMGIKGFLVSSKFIDGGVTGISMLVADITDIPLSTLLVVINVPFVILGYRKIGWKFALKTHWRFSYWPSVLPWYPIPTLLPTNSSRRCSEVSL